MRAKIADSSFGCVCDVGYAGTSCEQLIDPDWDSHQTGYIVGLSILGVF